jgi:hypothetical protein
VRAIREAGDFDVQRVRDKLQHGKFSGAIGDFAFDGNREVVQTPVLFVVRDGKLNAL